MVFTFLNIVIYEFQETHKLQAISFCYEIHSLKKQLKEMKIRVDDQLSRTETKKKEVSRLREEISRLKIMASYIKNGVPTNKIDVRPGRKLSEESNSTSLSNTRSSSASLRYEARDTLNSLLSYVGNTLLGVR